MESSCQSGGRLLPATPVAGCATPGSDTVTADSAELMGTEPPPQGRSPFRGWCRNKWTRTSPRKSCARNWKTTVSSQSEVSPNGTQRVRFVCPPTVTVARTFVSRSPALMPLLCLLRSAAPSSPRARAMCTCRQPMGASVVSVETSLGHSSGGAQAHSPAASAPLANGAGDSRAACSCAKDSKGWSDRRGSSMQMVSVPTSFLSAPPHAIFEVRDLANICVSDRFSLSWKL
mmetsp:Transcript_24212/g.69676  ORF Transcript_24212/g.69676 Transcript_24212/m.69676 type:complete len:231 (+) Transcript_24212:1182-1874(+)